ncbi:sugar (pentulose or hexulose) kinase [Frigoribacterium sp. PhB160]|uniref:FGGY-family carbohydrate kinase n=1 Tax=Frigoribacterium sp. PhB160 TaxID=2485192 RepID=UPI000F47C073|nr:FGGY family carbohydrate kinase [Frigoribacterium sp. PhB160]ROS61134.1 sugar (pentulose or hexulose) kinase [Frigoribacterium sp. PhB160]
MLPTITVDVGTTSIKLCFFDAGGRLLESGRVPTPTLPDAWGEIYDVDAVVDAVLAFAGDLSDPQRTSVARIAVTAVGESGGLVRSDGTLASPMVLWHDHRGAPYLDSLDASARARIYEVTGLPVNANYGLSKIAWAVHQAAGGLGDAQWLNVAEYLAARMTGQRWAEPSLASRTMALDLASSSWSEEVLEKLGLQKSVLPELRPASSGSGMDPAFAAASGLSPDVVVHVAGHDHMVGAVGAELLPGELLNSTGTTEGLLFLRDSPSLDDNFAASKLANGISCTGEGFTLFASIPTGGSAFATLQTMLDLDAETITGRIAGIHARYVAGNVDLDAAPLVLPQFRGSPPPTKDASARGIIAGLSSTTTSDDIILGCFLGMVLQFRDVLELFRAAPTRIKVIGPASQNLLWLQLKADLLGTPLSVSTFPEVVSRGAQSLASGEAGAWLSCDPFEVADDQQRSLRIQAWADRVRERWDYLKGVPS